MRKILNIARFAILFSIFISVFGIYLDIRFDRDWAQNMVIAIYFYTYIFHPLIFFIIGRRIILSTNAEKVPFCLLVILLLLAIVPTTYVIGLSAADGFGISGALEIVYLVFESAAFLAGILFFIYYVRRFIKKTIVSRDLISMHHYLFGAMIYFYFVRLTVISSILLAQLEI